MELDDTGSFTVKAHPLVLFAFPGNPEHMAKVMRMAKDVSESRHLAGSVPGVLSDGRSPRASTKTNRRLAHAKTGSPAFPARRAALADAE